MRENCMHMRKRFRRFLPVPRHATTLGLLSFLTIRLGSNLRFLRMARIIARNQAVQLSTEHWPRVSVLVPARNEAETISACLASLLQQRYPDFEVIVLDDGSSDDTGNLIDAVAAHYPQLVVLHSTGNPPAGWTGKSYACARLAERATGEWLLFTDADTVHSAQSLEQGISLASRLHVSLLSAIPCQRTETWSERVLVSFLLDFLPLVAVSLRAMWHGPSGGRRMPRVVANGQYVLVRAEKYRAVGGHASIRSALVDDFALARRFQDHGYTVALVDGTSLLACRMYRSAAEVWQGFSKNLLDALKMQSAPTSTLTSRGCKHLLRTYWTAPLFAWGYASLFVSPFASLIRGNQTRLARVEVCWLLLLRALVVWRLRRPLDEIFTTPLAAWSVLLLGMAALMRRIRGQPIVWKGRIY